MDLKAYKAKAPAINKALEDALAAHGLKMTKLTAGVEEIAGTVRYTIVAADMALKDANGNATTPEAERYRKNAEWFSLKAEWLGGILTLNREAFRLTGMVDRRSDKCFAVTRVKDDKPFLVDAATISRAFSVVASTVQ